IADDLHGARPTFPGRKRELARHPGVLPRTPPRVGAKLALVQKRSDRRQRASQQSLSQASEERRRHQVDLADPPLGIERAIPDRREVVEIRVPRHGLLEPFLDLSELAVLHLELYLLDVKIVDEALTIRLARLRGKPALRSFELLELADELL